MRHIGNLPTESQARRFEDYLLTLDIHGQVEPDDDSWAVWVYDEDLVERAREEFAAFQLDPAQAKYQNASREAEVRRKDEQKELERHRKNTIDVRKRFQRPLFARTPVTAALMAISILVAAATSSFDNLWNLCDRVEPIRTQLHISPIFVQNGRLEIYRDKWEGLRPILRGQVYRLVTPIFLHFTILHLLFNMLWLRMLGGAIEMRSGSWRLLGMVLAIAVASNLAQYFMSSPNFGGMSGVDFGLFAFIWMRSRYDPESGYFMPPRLVFFMIAWLFICFTGAAGPIANTAHTVGLLSGAFFGLWPTFLKNRSHRR